MKFVSHSFQFRDIYPYSANYLCPCKKLDSVKSFSILRYLGFLKKIENFDEATLLLLNCMMTYMKKKCTGIPIKTAKEALPFLPVFK